MSEKIKKVLILDGDKPVWQFGTFDVSENKIVTGVVMSSVRCAPGHTVMVDGEPAGTITSVGRLGPTGKWLIGLKPPPKAKAKAKPSATTGTAGKAKAPPAPPVTVAINEE